MSWLAVLGCGAIVVAVALPDTTRRVADDARLVGAYSSLPLTFETNRGQSNDAVKFLSRGPGYGLYLTRDDILLALGNLSSDESQTGLIRLGIEGSPAPPRGVGQMRGKVNYLMGSDRRRWKTGIETYRKVVYDRVRRGIDLVLRGNQRQLEYDFVVRAGADPSEIGLSLDRKAAWSLTDRGDLSITTGHGAIIQRRPIAYQRVGGKRRMVDARFDLDGNRLGFTVGQYARDRKLVIDPVVEYSTYLGGLTGYDQAEAIAVDRDGAAYIAGLTFSTDFPTKSAADPSPPGVTLCAPAQDPGFQPPPDSCHSDAFITKLNRSGTRILYSTYLGGDRSDRIQDLAADARGAVYVTGGTDSGNFPTTERALDSHAAGERRAMGVGLSVMGEAFVAKLSADGSKLAYSTLVGGGDAEEGMGIDINRDGSAAVTGITFSKSFATSRSAFDRVLNKPGQPPNVCSDLFVLRLAPKGRSLDYATLVGGSRLDFAWDIATDRRGRAFVMGETMSPDAPVTGDAIQRNGHVRTGPEVADCSRPLALLNDADPWIVGLGAKGRSLRYSSYFGGSGHEHGTAIAIRRGDVYLAGHTNSADFPLTRKAFDRTPKGTATEYDGFAAKLKDGSELAYSTLLGGNGDDWAMDLAVDRRGAVYLTGMTTSTDFPLTRDALETSYVGIGPQFFDAFLTRLQPGGRKLGYSSYFGGAGPDVARALAIDDRRGSAYVAGMTFSPDLSVTGDSVQPVFHGPITYSDGFAARFSGLGGVR